jgi:hypothetical protein
LVRLNESVDRVIVNSNGERDLPKSRKREKRLRQITSAMAIQRWSRRLKTDITPPSAADARPSNAYDSSSMRDALDGKLLTRMKIALSGPLHDSAPSAEIRAHLDDLATLLDEVGVAFDKLSSQTALKRTVSKMQGAGSSHEAKFKVKKEALADTWDALVELLPDSSREVSVPNDTPPVSQNPPQPQPLPLPQGADASTVKHIHSWSKVNSTLRVVI